MNRDLQDLSSMRRNYESAELLESNTPDNPFILFDVWFTEAKNSDIHEANAMVLASVNASMKPSARVVLLKSFSPSQGFVFYTNYESRKGQELAENPFVSLVFYWDMLERQVRIEGKVEKLDEATCDLYFNSRPIGSQIGAIVSPQSKIIENKQILEDLYNAELAKNTSPSRPSNWGGFAVIADKIEYWQGRPNRLHDRLVYERQDSQWSKHRLAP